jgi:hypothetical protein
MSATQLEGVIYVYCAVTAVCGGARYGLDNLLSGHVNMGLNRFGDGLSGCLGMFDVTFLGRCLRHTHGC